MPGAWSRQRAVEGRGPGQHTVSPLWERRRANYTQLAARGPGVSQLAVGRCGERGVRTRRWRGEEPGPGPEEQPGRQPALGLRLARCRNSESRTQRPATWSELSKLQLLGCNGAGKAWNALARPQRRGRWRMDGVCLAFSPTDLGDFPHRCGLRCEWGLTPPGRCRLVARAGSWGWPRWGSSPEMSPVH